MKEEFETRKQEVELYFDFLQKIAGDEHHVTRVADGIAAYVVSFLGIDGERKPHTIELIR